MLAALNSGGFTVAWSQKDTVLTNSWDVWGRAFSAGGAPTVPAFQNQQLSLRGSIPAQTGQRPQWRSGGLDQLGAGRKREGVYGRFLLGGNQVSGDEFRVNTTDRQPATGPGSGLERGGSFPGGLDQFYRRTPGFDLFGQMYTLTP